MSARAVRLAKETEGVTSVIDKREIRKPLETPFLRRRRRGSES
jgi:hypothetical protein